MANSTASTGMNMADNPPDLHQTSPLKAIHREWYSSGEKVREKLDVLTRKEWIEAYLFHLFRTSSFCFDLDKPLRQTRCTCLADLHNSVTLVERQLMAANLYSFAILDWNGQRQIAMEWMKHALNIKRFVRGTRLYLFPGSSGQIQYMVCKNAVARVIGFSRIRWNSIWKCVKTGVPLPLHGHKGRDGSNRSAKDDANINALKDFFQFVETLASPRATRLVKALSKTGENTCELRDNDDELIELPTYLSKRGLYKKFLSNNGYIYSSDAVGRITTTALTSSQGNDEDEDVTPRLPTPPSYQTFMRYWKTNHAKLVIPKPREDICGDCFIFANQTKFRINQLQATSDDDDDSSIMSGFEEEDIDGNLQSALASEELILKAASHVKAAQQQREYVNQKVAEAQQDRVAFPSERHERRWCFTADYAQNMYVPNFGGEQPGETYYYSPVNAYCFGVVDNSFNPSAMTAFVYLEDQGKKGGNNVCSLLWQEFGRNGLLPLFDLDTGIVFHNHVPAPEINLVFDNCGGQNKNRMVFRLLFYMVKRKLCRVARAIFLVRGHTKNSCDRMFNLLKKEYRKADVHTPKDLFEVLDNHPDIDVQKPQGFFDWDAMENRFMKVPKDVKKQHVFVVDCDRDPSISQLFCQTTHGEPETMQELVLNKYKDTDWGAMGFAKPDRIPEPGLQDIKWKELYDKWRLLVPPSKHKDWKFFNEDPGVKRRPTVTTNTKESKRLRTERSRTSTDAVDDHEAPDSSSIVENTENESGVV